MKKAAIKLKIILKRRSTNREMFHRKANKMFQNPAEFVEFEVKK